MCQTNIHKIRPQSAQGHTILQLWVDAVQWWFHNNPFLSNAVQLQGSLNPDFQVRLGLWGLLLYQPAGEAANHPFEPRQPLQL